MAQLPVPKSSFSVWRYQNRVLTPCFVTRLLGAAALGLCLAASSLHASAAESKPVRVGEGATILKLRAIAGQNGEAQSVQVRGIERVGRNSDGRLDVHVLYVHGMGWAERAGLLGDSWHLVRAIEREYGVTGSVMNMARMCPDGSHVGPAPADGGLQFTGSALHGFATDDPHTPVVLGAIACMDRVVVDLGERGRISIYRLLWDNYLYDSALYPHIGYDDNLFGPYETTRPSALPGTPQPETYEDLYALRARRTAEVKTDMSSYGLSEAALYLGPYGAHMRKAVAAAACVVADEAQGLRSPFADLASKHESLKSTQDAYVGVGVDDACKPENATHSTLPFAIVTESLGSRVVFDTFGRDEDVKLAQRLGQDASGEPPEIFMLANQIPVLAPGRLQEAAGTEASRVKARLVALSEINDLLSYELVPYFEHLYNMRCRPQPEQFSGSDPQCPTTGRNEVQMSQHRALLRDKAARAELIRQIGFDVVDVRTRFAKAIPGYPEAIDPAEAHVGYLDQVDLLRLMMCGVSNGRVRTAADGCLAR